MQYWVDNRGFLCRALGLDPDDGKLDERYLTQALSILMHGVSGGRKGSRVRTFIWR